MRMIVERWWLVFPIGGLLLAVIGVSQDVRDGIRNRRPLPALDRTPRTATVLARSAAPRKPIRGGTQIPGDFLLVEVAYVDADGRTRREPLADLFPGTEAERFAVGTTWQVYGFQRPTGRCLLAEAHDDVARIGYHLDGVRAKEERGAFPPRTGSPILGVLTFADTRSGPIEPAGGRRASWPGDPASAWAESAETSAFPHHSRPPRPVPRLTTTADVAQHDESLIGTLAYGAPIFWVCLPLAAFGFLGFHADEVNGWAWAAVAVWLLVALAVLAFRATVYPRAHRATLEHALEQGVLCDVFDSPLSIPGSDTDTSTKILVRVDLPVERAARVVAALTTWASRTEARDAWGAKPGQIHYRAIASAELFGEEAAGGYLVRDVRAEPGEWALLCPSEGDEYPDAPFRMGEYHRITRPKGARG